MNTEQFRADFEAWITAPPYEKPVNLNPDSSGFPGQYRAYEVQLAWEAYQAGRAALQSQDREDSERYRLLRRGQKWSVIDGVGNELRAEGLDAAIDHARRAEGES